MTGESRLCLNPDLALRPSTGCVLMVNTADTRTPTFHLHPVTAVVLSRFDGTRTAADIAQELQAVFGLTEAQAAGTVRGARKRFRIFLKEGLVRPAQDIAELIVPGRFHLNRYEAPVVLQWLVTAYCDRGCLYCYQAAKRTTTARDATLPLERVYELIDEAAAIGVSMIKLGGGEPFLRPDLLEVIRAIRERGLDITLLTKHSFDREGAQRLADTGLREISISLDAADETVGDTLVGQRGYTQLALASIRNLVDAGIKTSVAVVACTASLPHLEESIRIWREAGASAIDIGPYFDSQGRSPDRLKLTPAQMAEVTELVNRYQNAPACPVSFSSNCATPSTGPVPCSQGLSTMAFLPDGRVSRCEHLTTVTEETVLGDLRTQSLLEVWNSQRYVDAIFPREELFAGTACHGCARFAKCNAVGRCILVPLVEQNRLYGPNCYEPWARAAGEET